MPKVSIIIPVYNVEQYLGRCLDSLLEQSFEDIEIICINDMSPDDSEKILSEYAGRYPDKITVLKNEENLGPGRSRTKGIEIARGEYIMFVDSDDYVAKDYVSTYLEHAEAFDVVVGGYTKDIHGRLVVHTVPDSAWSILTYPIGCAKLFRKDFIVRNHIDFSDIRCGEDIFFSLSVFYCKARYRVIDYAGYYYYYNEKSTTSTLSYDKKHEEFVSGIYDRFLEKYDINAVSEKRRRAIEYNYVANMINALITYGHGCGIRLMREKYEFFMRDLKEKFPDYRSNPCFGILKPKGQTLKIRLGVGVTMGLHRLRLDRLMFYVISLI